MSVQLAWRNVSHNRKRTAAALAGIAFSVFLVFMQIGFLDTARRGSVQLYRDLDFDILITSDKYEILDGAGVFERTRLVQAMMVPGVQKLAPFLIGRAYWENTDTEVVSTLLLFGCELDPDFYRAPLIRDQLNTLSGVNTAMLDTLSHANYGPLVVGRKAEINGVEMTVSSLFTLGLGFYREGSAMTSLNNFRRFMKSDPGKTSFGLVKVAPGSDPLKVRDALRRQLPSDVIVWERNQLIEREQDYFLNVKPVGIIFQVGALVALVVGGVILFQVLSAEIANKMGEYATMKAMGYRNRSIYLVGMQQAWIYALISYLVALLFTSVLFWVAHLLSRLPIHVTGGLALKVFLLTFGICTLSSLLALLKLRKADPADLY